MRDIDIESIFFRDIADLRIVSGFRLENHTDAQAVVAIRRGDTELMRAPVAAVAPRTNDDGVTIFWPGRYEWNAPAGAEFVSTGEPFVADLTEGVSIEWW